AGEVSPDGLLASIAEEGAITLPRPGEDADTRIACLRLSPAESVDFLTSIHSAANPKIGDSLRCWRLLAQFACSLVQRRQFVPDLDVDADRRVTGRWRVFVENPVEMDWLERVVAALPPAACAAPSPSARQMPDATAVVDCFLAVTAEALIR